MVSGGASFADGDWNTGKEPTRRWRGTCSGQSLNDLDLSNPWISIWLSLKNKMVEHFQKTFVVFKDVVWYDTLLASPMKSWTSWGCAFFIGSPLLLEGLQGERRGRGGSARKPVVVRAEPLSIWIRCHKLFCSEEGAFMNLTKFQSKNAQNATISRFQLGWLVAGNYCKTQWRKPCILNCQLSWSHVRYWAASRTWKSGARPAGLKLYHLFGATKCQNVTKARATTLSTRLVPQRFKLGQDLWVRPWRHGEDSTFQLHAIEIIGNDLELYPTH